LALKVDPTDGNICALTVTFDAELALTGLSCDSSELSHSLGVLKVVVGVDLALLVRVMHQIVGQLILAAPEAGVNSYAVSPLYVCWSGNCSLSEFFVGVGGLHGVLDVVFLDVILILIIMKLSF